MKIRLCLVALSCLMVHSQAVWGQTQKIADWEYKQLRNPSDEYLNYFAKEGWEISSAAGGSGDSNSFVVVIMRRSRSHPLFGTKTEDNPKPAPPPPNNACKLTASQAPAIRGLRLGMTSEELFALFPASERETFDRVQKLKSAELSPNYGYSSFSLPPSKYATLDRFKGIGSFTFDLLDSKVISIRAYYSDTPEFEDMEQLMAVITKQLSLPEFEEWSNYGPYFRSSSISCDGFNVQVIGNSTNFSIFLGNSTTHKIIADRKKADLAKKREGFQL